MRCSVCGTPGTLEDNFCRRCGADQRTPRMPAKRSPKLPAPWRNAAPAVAQSAALVVAGVAAEWLLSRAAKRALRLPLDLLGEPTRPKGKALVPRKGVPASEGGLAISETVVMRRIILRR
jgi:hypothetical protein